jgi:hypothetical protein
LLNQNKSAILRIGRFFAELLLLNYSCETIVNLISAWVCSLSFDGQTLETDFASKSSFSINSKPRVL